MDSFVQTSKTFQRWVVPGDGGDVDSLPSLLKLLNCEPGDLVGKDVVVGTADGSKVMDVRILRYDATMTGV